MKMNNLSKILIIDDEEVILDSCSQILEGSGHSVTTTSNGDQGLKLLGEIKPDLVLLDLKMPGISGMEVLEKIISFDPTIVTVIITGYATVDSAVEAMKKGAYDFLPKPFTPDEFRMVIRRGLERRKLILEAISLRKEKEILRENFAAIVSHELKSPLGAIQQNLFAMTDELSGKLSESQLARFDRMKSRINDLLDIIHSWLRVLSVDIQKIQESFNPLSVQDLITRAVEIVEPHAIRKNIHILTSVEPGADTIEAEQVSFVEALVNIISNAVKYSYPGSKVYVNAK